MANLVQTQARLVYSLLRIALRVAGRFRIPSSTTQELARIATFEVLQKEGFTQASIARHLNQSERHMRVFARRLRSEFFAEERDAGVLRRVEEKIAQKPMYREDLRRLLSDVGQVEVNQAMDELLAEQRITFADDGRLQLGTRYALLTSDNFHGRLDALNHFLEGFHQAVQHRLIYDDKARSMIKTLSFKAPPEQLAAFITDFERTLRLGVAQLEEQVTFEGHGERFTLGILLAPATDSRVDKLS